MSRECYILSLLHFQEKSENGLAQILTKFFTMQNPNWGLFTPKHNIIRVFNLLLFITSSISEYKQHKTVVTHKYTLVLRLHGTRPIGPCGGIYMVGQKNCTRCLQ